MGMICESFFKSMTLNSSVGAAAGWVPHSLTIHPAAVSVISTLAWMSRLLCSLRIMASVSGSLLFSTL